MNATIAIKFSLPMGDLIYACAGIKAVCALGKTKADIYLGLDVQMKFLDGIRSGLTRKTYEMAKPLIESQNWCNSVQEYVDQPVDMDLDKTQLDPEINIPVMPYGSISHWYRFLFPLMSGDFSEPWIEVTRHGWILDQAILVNRTARYRNDSIDYSFLKQWESLIYFVGLPEEHERFQQETRLSIKHLEMRNFLELASAISTCRLFIGNQSMCFALAEAMKSRRILEVCTFAPNVIPEGPNGDEFIYQFHLEWLVKRAMG